MSLGEIIMNNYCLQPDSLNLLFSINSGTVSNGIKDLGIIADITISTNISQRKSKYKRRRKEYKHQEEDTVQVRKAACIYILYTSSNTERLPHLATILSVSFAFPSKYQFTSSSSKIPRRHIGHTAFPCFSHSSIQFWWKMCLQGSVLIASPFFSVSRQIVHSSGFSGSISRPLFGQKDMIPTPLHKHLQQSKRVNLRVVEALPSPNRTREYTLKENIHKSWSSSSTLRIPFTTH